MKIKIKSRTLSSIALIQVIFLLLLPFAYPVQAISIDNASDFVDPITDAIIDSSKETTQEALKELLESFGLGEEQFSNIGETLNVAENKNNAPEVQILFSPTSPKVGEKLTATALAKYFQQDKSNLYYTWYLKHEEGNVDHDGNGKINIEDYKIEAMRLIAQNGYRSEKADYETTADDDDDDDGFGPLKKAFNDSKVPFGGSNLKKPSGGFRCYVQDFKSGIAYEIVDGTSGSADSDEDDCDNDGSNTSITDYHHTTSGSSDGGTSMVLCPNQAKVFSSCTMDDGTSIPYHGMDNGRHAYWNMNTATTGTMTCTGSGGTSTFTVTSGIDYSRSCPDSSTCSGAGGGGTSGCKHLFPNAPGFTTGDGKFTGEEEEFWGTNPLDPDAAGDGIGDEAAVAGVGRDKLTWTYNKGDLVGVAVEGNSLNTTKYADSSYMVMWALPKNTFNVKGSASDCKIESKSSHKTTVNNVDVKIKTAEIDINKCLEENFVDPLEGGQPENLEVDIDYSPSNPFNNSLETGAQNGSKVAVQSIINNSGNDVEDVYYKWTVQGLYDDNFVNGDWEDITSALDIGITEGLNKDSINFSLNLKEDEDAYKAVFGDEGTHGYLKVILDVEENYDSGVTRSGTGEQIIKITSGVKNKIGLYRATYGSDNKLSIDDTAELCKPQGGDGSYNTTICSVTNNEIIAAKLDTDGTNLKNFSWTLNGEPIECTNDISDSCGNSKQTNTVFFPIKGNSGDRYVLKISANDVESGSDASNKGIKTEINQVFQIAEPMVKLGPAGETSGEDCSNSTAGFQSKLMGKYDDISDDEEFSISECSSRIFTSTAGSSMTVKARFNPVFVENYIKDVKWTVNGEEQDADGTTLTIDGSEGVAGGSYTISFSAAYAQDRNSKRALNSKFNVSQLDLSQSELSDTIKIRVGESVGNETATQKTTKIMANLVSNLPTQLLFLFRVALTVATVVFITGMISSLGIRKV